MTVYKVVDMVGTSGTSVSDAIRGAISRASETLDELRWFEVKEIRGTVAEDEVIQYQVKIELGFTVHAHEDSGEHSRKGGSRAARSIQAQSAAKSGERRRSDIARGFTKQPPGH